MASSMAGSPSLVPGILMRRFGRPARACRVLAAASVLAVSWASSGDTSNDTQPSTPRVRSQIGRNRSAARVRSSSASSKNNSSPRSEEHTSELQSQSNLVCRLLLEKKKKNTNHELLQQPYESKHLTLKSTIYYAHIHATNWCNCSQLQTGPRRIYFAFTH